MTLASDRSCRTKYIKEHNILISNKIEVKIFIFSFKITQIENLIFHFNTKLKIAEYIHNILHLFFYLSMYLSSE